MAQAAQRKVRIIPATKPLASTGPRRSGKQRVAAYCRVSTDSEEQLNSYEAQKSYYTQKIEENSDWEMAGIFADEGLSGTSLRQHRTILHKSEPASPMRLAGKGTVSLTCLSAN